MDNDSLEEKLTAMRRREPSAELDQRANEAFRAAHVRAQSKRNSTWWWLVAATATGGVMVLALLATRQSPRTIVSAPVVYRVETQGRVREMLLNDATDHEEPPPFTVSTHRP